jgi:hypothetical protein
VIPDDLPFDLTKIGEVLEQHNVRYVVGGMSGAFHGMLDYRTKDVGRGIAMPAASLNDIIRMKEAADRYKDHLALPELRRHRADRYPELGTDQDPFGDFDSEAGAE